MLSITIEEYWHFSRTFRQWRDIFFRSNPQFRAIVLADKFQRPENIAPIVGETRERASAAVKWLCNAQDARSDGGVSYGYFPLSECRGWDVSYPETTGYIITSLIRYAQRTRSQELIERARRMAYWEAQIQMPSGAVQGGKVTTSENRTPATFNTGMVLDGFVTLLEHCDDPILLQAALRAADFLCNDLTEEGLFVTNGRFVGKDGVKIYNVLCAWPLYRLGRLTDTPRYQKSAIHAVEGVLRYQKENGWFAKNCFSDSGAEHPLTHTIAYTCQGILEVGVATEREDFVQAAERAWKATTAQMYPNGFLAGRFDRSWRATETWSCLTGSAQMSLLGYRLAAILNNREYVSDADRLLNFLKGVQRLNTGNPGIDGGLAGSYPIMGGYMPAGYPNWASKYLLDALMAQDEQSGD